MKQEPEEPPQDQPVTEEQPSTTETEKEPEIIPGSLEDDNPNINPVENPWAGMVSEPEPVYVAMGKLPRRPLPITGEERRRIMASAAQSRQTWRSREQEAVQRRTKQEYQASGSVSRPLAHTRSWVKQEFSWATQADYATEAAPVEPQGDMQ